MACHAHYAPVAQSAEAQGLSPCQYRFESDLAYFFQYIQQQFMKIVRKDNVTQTYVKDNPIVHGQRVDIIRRCTALFVDAIFLHNNIWH